MLIALVLLLIAALVSSLAIGAAHDGDRSPGAAPGVAASSQSIKVGATGPPSDEPVSGTSASGKQAGSTSPGARSGQPDGGGAPQQPRETAALDQALTTALRPVTALDHGSLSVGVVNVTTGTEALYQPRQRSLAPGFTRADILAAVLYQHQSAHTQLSPAEASQAVHLIENGDRAAAAALWRAVGGGAGLRAANRALGLSRTRPGSGGRWQATTTTIADQLRLISDLTLSLSPLMSGWRDYELGLMAKVVPSLAWGVRVAAGGASAYAVASGAVSQRRHWDIDSIGAVQRDGQELLIVVLSSGNPARAGGVTGLQAAVLAAARTLGAREG